MTTISAIAQRIQQHVAEVPGIIATMSDDVFCHKSAPGKWSKKEILGHLIDSAANNHHRIIRAQYEYQPHISYDQNKWTTLNHYHDMPSANVIALWAAYNTHLAALITRLSPEALQCTCKTDEEQLLTLQALIPDYLVHMEHHLKQITN